MRQKISASLIGLALGLGFAAPVAFADVWLCMLPNGTNLYSDRGGGPDCRLIKMKKNVANESFTPAMRGLPQAPVASEDSATSASSDSTASAAPTAPSATVESPRPHVQLQPLTNPPVGGRGRLRRLAWWDLHVRSRALDRRRRSRRRGGRGRICRSRCGRILRRHRCLGESSHRRGEALVGYVLLHLDEATVRAATSVAIEVRSIR